MPWQPQSVNDAAPAFHRVLLMTDGQDKPRSRAYDAVLLDSTGIMNLPADVTLYLAKRDSLFATCRAGDVLLVYTTLADGRGYVRTGEGARLEHRSASQISLNQGKLRFLARRSRSKIEDLLSQCRVYYSLQSVSTQSSADTSPETHQQDTFLCKSADLQILDTSISADIADVALINSLVLGDRSALTRDQHEAFQDAGAMHVLAVSGLHVGIILAIITFIITLGGILKVDNIARHTPRGKRLLVLQRLFIFAGIWVYAFLSGLSTSVLRSAIMFSCIPVFGPSDKSSTRFNSPALAALIILIINPAAIRAPGFLLSFSAVLALMYYMPRWNKHLASLRRTIFARHSSQTSQHPAPLQPLNIDEYGHIIPTPVEEESPKKNPIPEKTKRLLYKIYRWLRDLLLASLAAQIGTLPWTLLFFGQSANYFMLTNLLVIPCATLLASATILTLFVGGIFGVCGFSAWLMHLTDSIAHFMNASVFWVQHLPGATSFFTFTPALTVLLILLILFLTLAARRISAKEKAKRGYLYLLFATLTAIAIIVLYAHTIGA